MERTYLTSVAVLPGFWTVFVWYLGRMSGDICQAIVLRYCDLCFDACWSAPLAELSPVRLYFPCKAHLQPFCVWNNNFLCASLALCLGLNKLPVKHQY